MEPAALTESALGSLLLKPSSSSSASHGDRESTSGKTRPLEKLMRAVLARVAPASPRKVSPCSGADKPTLTAGLITSSKTCSNACAELREPKLASSRATPALSACMRRPAGAITAVSLDATVDASVTT
eukprot:1300136-Pleurochrysis_carterae.AAC.2